MALPIDADRVYCYGAVVAPPDDRIPERSPAERLRELFSEFAEPAATLLDALDDCVRTIPTIPDALAAYQARRQPRAEWVRAQTHRRDHTRYLPPMIRDNVLRLLGPRIFHTNYRPLLDEP